MRHEDQRVSYPIRLADMLMVVEENLGRQKYTPPLLFHSARASSRECCRGVVDPDDATQVGHFWNSLYKREQGKE